MSSSVRRRKVRLVALRRLLRGRRCSSRSCRSPSSCFSSSSAGVQSLNLDFFTNMPKPVGEAGGGMANAIVGTLMLTGLGALFADSDRRS